MTETLAVPSSPLFIRALRGDLTNPAALRSEKQRGLHGRLLLLNLALGVVVGATMGSFGFLTAGRTHEQAVLQVASSGGKLALLTVLPLVITTPSLVVVSALLRVNLSVGLVTRLVFVMNTTALSLMASFAPVSAFFMLTTRDYAFTKSVHLVIALLSGAVAVVTFLRALRQAGIDRIATGASPDRQVPHVRGRSVLGWTEACMMLGWLVLYGYISQEFVWSMRPFIGNPEMDFEFFREGQGSLLEQVQILLRRLTR